MQAAPMAPARPRRSRMWRGRFHPRESSCPCDIIVKTSENADEEVGDPDAARASGFQASSALDAASRRRHPRQYRAHRERQPVHKCSGRRRLGAFYSRDRVLAAAGCLLQSRAVNLRCAGCVKRARIEGAVH